MAFLLILTIGFLYEWKRGASDRESKHKGKVCKFNKSYVIVKLKNHTITKLNFSNEYIASFCEILVKDLNTHLYHRIKPKEKALKRGLIDQPTPAVSNYVDEPRTVAHSCVPNPVFERSEVDHRKREQGWLRSLTCKSFVLASFKRRTR